MMKKALLLCAAWLFVGSSAWAMENGRISVYEGRNGESQEYIEAYRPSERLRLYKRGLSSGCYAAQFSRIRLLPDQKKPLVDAIDQYIKTNQKGEEWRKAFDAASE